MGPGFSSIPALKRRILPTPPLKEPAPSDENFRFEDFHEDFQKTEVRPRNFEDHDSGQKLRPILKDKREKEEDRDTRGREKKINPRGKVCFNVSDSEVERTDSDRSRTPSPFLSTNRYYPWLYGNKEEEGGIYLERSKIRKKEEKVEASRLWMKSMVLSFSKKKCNLQKCIIKKRSMLVQL